MSLKIPKNISISLKEVKFIPQIIKDYLNRSEKLKNLFGLYPDIDNFKKQIELKSRDKTDRELLFETISNQYKGLEIEEKTKTNLSLLKEENCYTITTGHQLNLFLGAPYVIEKILTTIVLSEKLSERYKDYKFVPMFWLAGEDDDFEEINHFYINGEKFEWQTKDKGKKVGKMKLESLQPLLKLLETKVDNNPIFSIFSKAYKDNENICNAHREILNKLFGKYGLICLDGDDRRLKNKFLPFIKDEIINNSSFIEVEKSNAYITSIYKKNQANPSKINLFYVEDDKRRKINIEDKELENHINIKKQELLKDINASQFSPNVILKPLYQELLLPNLCYIGGAAELNYWLELKGVFDYHQITFPLIKLRKFIFFTKNKDLKTIAKNKITIDELFMDSYQLTKKKLVDNKINLDDFDKYNKVIEDMFSSLKEKAKKNDKSLIDHIEAQKIRQLKNLDHIKNKFIKSQLSKYKTISNQIEELKNNLFPQNKPQDRFYSCFEYLNKHPDLIDILYRDMDVFRDYLEFKLIN